MTSSGTVAASLAHTTDSATPATPATPEFQTSSLPLGGTTPGKSRNDFETSSADLQSTDSPSSNTLSPLPHRTIPLLSSPPSRGLEGSPAHPYIVTAANISTIATTATTWEQSEFDDDSGFSDITGDLTSPEPGYLEPKYSNYLFPCDDEELLEREPLTHEAISRLRKHYANSTLRTEHLHLDPFEKNPQKVIELGAGTCLWANDFVDAFPSAEVEAIDINTIALTTHKLSQNVSPVIDDVEKSWVFEESSLDFIRAGNLLHSIKDRPRLFKECRRSLKPLARVEVVGFDYVPHAEDNSVVENGLFTFYETFASALSNANFDLNAITKAREELKSAGFINVREKVVRMPIGEWMDDRELKEIGSLFEAVVKSAIPDIAARAIDEELDWSSREVTVLGAIARQSFPSPMYFPLYIVTGQKPSMVKGI